jgi:hypothetical protein
MDNKTKNLALYHLLKSYELGYEKAKYMLENVFGENVKFPTSKEYACIQ